MSLTFTICANNYLAHTNVLASSYKKYHPDSVFVIAILDKPNKNVEYNKLGANEVIWIHELFPDLIDKLKEKYGIAELCTAVKPELFSHFFSKGFDSVLYIDPDIKVFSKFKEVFEKLNTYDVILTPHICSPTGEVGHPLDKDLMRTGIYNLGFLAMNCTPETLAFVNWWDKRVKSFGYHDLQKGYFYDQIWLGYAPAFLDKVYILRHLGYNVANWNLHEREVIEKKGNFYINDETTPLRFFHYSHYKMGNEPIIASYNENFNLKNRADIVPVFNNYKTSLEDSGYHQLKNIAYNYGKPIDQKEPIKPKKQSRLKRSAYLLKKVFRILITGK
ncbi:hypothetical protein [Flavisericum labens]|uniref:hypothetical protein n=1 Tax=Flavisericum labens TaxID=3377112 RepID=UPI00387AC5A9